MQEIVASLGKEIHGNPSSPHGAGRAASVLITEARRAVAQSLGADVGEIIFVSGGSEANNLCTAGVLRAQNSSQCHAIMSAVEHPSVREPLEYYFSQEQNRAPENLQILNVDSDGRLNLEQIIAALKPTTRLVTIMVANNETGTCQPVKEFAQWLHDVRWVKDPRYFELPNDLTIEILRELHFHVDAVQAWGKIPASEWFLPGVDSCSMSAHKLGGLSGIGALCLRRGRRFQPAIRGGAQERSRRAGTENLIGILSMGIVAGQIQLPQWWQKVENTSALLQKLYIELSGLPGVLFNTPKDNRLPNTLNFCVEPAAAKVTGEDILMELDMQGIAASSGSACSSGANLPSKIIAAQGRSALLARNAIRLSLGMQTSVADVEQCIQALQQIFGIAPKSCMAP